MKFLIILTLYALCVYVRSDLDLNVVVPNLSETFMANLTIDTTDPNPSLKKLRAWSTQDNVGQIYNIVIEIPPGHHQYPAGGYFKQIRTADKYYEVFPTINGDQFCTCTFYPYIPYWWWVDDAVPIDPPPGTVGLSCYFYVYLGEEICLPTSTPNIAVMEMKYFFGLSIRAMMYDTYVPNLVNHTLSGMDPACLNTACI